jgi:hypothetical protein
MISVPQAAYFWVQMLVRVSLQYRRQWLKANDRKEGIGNGRKAECGTNEDIDQ